MARVKGASSVVGVVGVAVVVVLTPWGVPFAGADFAVPARMTGVASGNLDSTGNVVQNTGRVLNILAQFQSITEWLYELQTPELYRLAANFRAVMDSLVESGSPVFQGLSNAARISSGNISATFDGIRRQINETVALDAPHQAILNGSRWFLGDAAVGNFSAALDQLARSVANLSAVLDDIEPALVDIQRLPRPTQPLVDGLYPRDGIRRLNAILQQHASVGAATVPQINAVVNRVRLMDAFIARLDSLAAAQRTQLANSARAVNGTVHAGVQLRLQTALGALRNGFAAGLTAASRNLRPFTVDDLEDLRWVAHNTTQLLDARVRNVSQTLAVLGDGVGGVRGLVDGGEATVVLNRSIAAVTELAWRVALSVTSTVPRADACFARHNYEFDKILRLVSGALEGCGQGEARTVQSVGGALVGTLGMAQAQLEAETRQYQQCLAGLTASSPDELKRQRSVCLWGAARFSQWIGTAVVDGQLGAFYELLRDERGYSVSRYRECLLVADRLMVGEVVYLGRSVVTCLNQTATR